MKLLSSHFVAPAIFAALSVLVGCSSDSPSPGTGGAAGSGTAGAAAAGKGGSAGASAGSGGSGVAGASAGAAGSTAGGGSAGSSAAGTGGGEPPIEASFNTVKEMIRQTPCTGGVCHGVEFVPLHWTADDPKLHEILTTHVTKNCGKLVNTANPADSALLKVLQGECGTAPNITRRMPLEACWPETPQTEYPCIPPEKIAAIQAWIAKGAPAQ